MKPLIQVQAVSQRFSTASGEFVALQNVSFDIHEGETVSLIGHSGCGKSTLLKGLARLLRPRGGTVLLDGHAIHDLPTRELARQLGILPQTPTAPEGLTVYELVAQGRFPHQGLFHQWSAEDEIKTREAITATHLIPFADRPLDTLSGGQRQRAWIALTLAQDTSILLLDEPTTYLDIGHQLEVMELIERLNRERQMTIVLVLHDLNQAARFGRRMIVLKDGAIMADGAPWDVMTREMLAAVFRVQADVIPDPVSGVPICLPFRTLEGSQPSENAAANFLRD